MRKIKLGLLPQIIIAVILGIVCSSFFPTILTRAFATINSIFGNFLGFTIPLIILGLVAPGIAELGKGAGKLLGITALLAYGSTLFAGFFSYFVCNWSYPSILVRDGALQSIEEGISGKILPYFTIDMPPLMGITSALVFAFIMGLGLSAVKGDKLRGILNEFRDLVVVVITKAIIPILPLYIFGIFLVIGAE